VDGKEQNANNTQLFHPSTGSPKQHLRRQPVLHHQGQHPLRPSPCTSGGNNGDSFHLHQDQRQHPPPPQHLRPSGYGQSYMLVSVSLHPSCHHRLHGHVSSPNKQRMPGPSSQGPQHVGQAVPLPLQCRPTSPQTLPGPHLGNKVRQRSSTNHRQQQQQHRRQCQVH